MIKKELVILSAAVVVVCLLVAGGFLAYRHMTEPSVEQLKHAVLTRQEDIGALKMAERASVSGDYRLRGRAVLLLSQLMTAKDEDIAGRAEIALRNVANNDKDPHMRELAHLHLGLRRGEASR